MTDIVIFDVKMDDQYAAKYLLESRDKDLAVIISDVADTEGAKRVINSIFCDLKAAGRTSVKNITYHEGDKREEAHDWEKIFDVTSQDAPDFLPLPPCTGTETVYCFAPYSKAAHFKDAACFIVAMGHNLNSSGISVDELASFKNLKTLNNFESYPVGLEGGRNTYEQAQHLAKSSPTLQRSLPYALNNSVQFMAKQLTKFANGEKGGEPFPDPKPKDEVYQTLKENNTEALRDYAKAVFKHFSGEELQVGPLGVLNPTETYLDRVVDQIFNGIMVECSDAQHAAGIDIGDQVPGRLIEEETKFGKEIRFKADPQGKAKCVKNLTREAVWEQLCKSMGDGPSKKKARCA